MANVISKGTLFPEKLTTEMFNAVRGKSSLAKLSDREPLAFSGNRIFTFSLDKEVDLVAENGAKSNGGATVTAVNMVPVKIEYGVRVSDEFMYAAEEERLQYLRAFADGFARKVARGLDIMAIHGFNPRTGAAAATIGDNHLDAKVTQTVTFDADDPNANVEAAVAMVEGADHEVTGLAMAPTFRSALGTQTNGNGNPMFPELSWGTNPDTVRGLEVDANSTISFNSNTDRAIVGNFRDMFKWGYARDVSIEVIEYGNPDNDAAAGDLKGHNQVYLRGEAYIGWGILDGTAFARIVTA